MPAVNLSEYQDRFFQKGYIDKYDEIISSFKVTFLKDNRQDQTKEMMLFLSKKKIILPSSDLEQLEFMFEYKDIIAFKRFKMSLLSVGIGIEYRNWDIGEISLVKFAIWGREKLINFINEFRPPANMPAQVELTEEERWYNTACALLILANKGNLNIYGGFPVIEEVKFEYRNSLKKWWHITDRASAESKIYWLETQGHRAEFTTKMAELSKCIYGINSYDKKLQITSICKHYKISESQALDMLSVHDNYVEFGDAAIDGWDYVRILNLLSQCYLAGYFTKEEALEKSEEIATIIRTKFKSWDALINSYLFGCEFKNKGTSIERRKQFYDIKSKADNIFDSMWE
ncbi:hypothetical protein AN639_10120 [Candidatus Epulonipiscium fishelsonii]|uniref:Uncharacterized protein n=1 Tax=Candidatus Epulonipiscium fishelsonii TaxID=77094 RepID=A0ACC8X8F4_9FIRM|nr:hypothetical protein AN396_11220 [Epulopiscium sp. SCG-B11WGA-EpuloA1]ONI43677.1 hypothetical protein AN639_10120 [Epulopiscium sp. SCG-B05WGA-EpuloA1]